MGHRFDRTYIDTTVCEESFVEGDILHHALDEIGVVADDGTTTCKTEFAGREVDDVHLVGQKVIDFLRCHVLALCLTGLHEVDVVLKE